MNSSDTAKIASNVKGLFFTKYLWAGYIFIFLSFGTALGLSAWYGQRYIESSADAETHSIAVALDELSRRQVQTLALPLDLVVSEIRKNGGIERMSPVRLQNLFARIKTDMPTTEVRDFFVVDKDGTLLNTSRPPEAAYRKRIYRSNPEFEYAKKQINPIILTSATSPADGKNLLVLMRVLKNANGRFAGMVGVTRTFDEFEKFYDSLDLHFEITFAIVRDDGKILYHYPVHDVSLGDQVRFTKTLESDSEGSMQIKSDVGGGSRTGFYKFVSNYSTMIFVGYDAKTVLAGWRNVIRGGLLLFAIFMLAMAVVVRIAQRRQWAVESLVEEFRRRDDMIRKIQTPTEVLTGSEFLKELVVQLCTVFDAGSGVIGLLLPEHTDLVKCVVNYSDGEFLPEQEYNLRCTPFNGLKPGEFFAHSRSTSAIYPEDPLLGYRNTESSLGVVLQNSERQAIGILMVYCEHEMQEMNLKRAIMSVFAARVGAELERVHTDELRKEVEVLRKQIENRSLQTKNLESMNAMAEGLANDFNNILAIILSSTERLLSMHKDSVQDQHYLDSIKKASHRARHLVSQISIFNENEEGETQNPVQVKALFCEADEFLKSVLPDNMRVELSLGECAELMISADPNQLQQALMNLGLNAVKSIGIGGGTIKISLQKNRIKGKLYIKCILHHGGDELGREEVEKIFNPFFAQNMSMIVVQRIVTNHHGFIEVKSEMGRGTDYEIFLPVIESEITAQALKKRTVKTEKMVLIVDDEPEIGLLIKELLEIEGLKVQAEIDPVKALRMFEQNPSNYFIIISDLAMPEMSGFEFCRRVRTHHPDIPLLLWSGYYQYLDQELQDLNVKVLSKPVDAQKLIQLINAEVSQLATQDASKGEAALGSAP